MEHKKISAVKYVAGKAEKTLETLTGEEALQIKINGRSYTVTMRTPGDDNVLAAGLLLTERIIETREDIIDIVEIPGPMKGHAMAVNVQVREDVLEGKNLFNRSIASSASCGVCGKTELCDLIPAGKPLPAFEKFNIDLIPALVEQMSSAQLTFEKTGGSHAAAIFSIDGNLMSAKEDIGRHNAVDKAIGDLFLRDLLHKASILFISGRTSYEIASKCGEAAIPFLLGVSAPSSLAVDFCREKGITLVGFCRESRATVYTHNENISAHTAKSGYRHYHEA